MYEVVDANGQIAQDSSLRGAIVALVTALDDGYDACLRSHGAGSATVLDVDGMTLASGVTQSEASILVARFAGRGAYVAE